MNIKKITVISALTLFTIFLITVRIIFPIETKVSDTKRFYDIGYIKNDWPDNTSFENISSRYLDIKFDLVFTKGLFSECLNGTITIENKEYFINDYDLRSGTQTITCTFGGGTGTPNDSVMYVCDDLSHYMLAIAQKKGDKIAGVWLNCTDISDYKTAMTELFPHWHWSSE